MSKASSVGPLLSKNRAFFWNFHKIFDWYKDDFGNVLESVARYRSEGGQQLLSGAWKIEYQDNDWSLNQAKE